MYEHAFGKGEEVEEALQSDIDVKTEPYERLGSLILPSGDLVQIKVEESEVAAEPKPSPSKTNNRRIELSIETKREIIRRFDSLPKMSQQNASKVLQIPRMTLRRMLSKRDEIMDAKNSSMKRYRDPIQ